MHLALTEPSVILYLSSDSQLPNKIRANILLVSPFVLPRKGQYF